MEKTYQPFILKLCEDIFEDLTPDIKPTERNKTTLCDMLTQKFLDGELSEGDEQIFDSEKEIEDFINLCFVNDNLDDLHKRGFIGSYNDGESYFLTDMGKLYVENLDCLKD